jgi:DNA-binding transcriptional LysR family regulator
LTRSIQAAEAEYGMRLFDRGAQEVTPTPAGTFVVERARRLVFDSRALRRDVELYRDRKLGDVALGVGPFPAETLLPELLGFVRRTAPAARVRVEVGNWEGLLQHLSAERIEFFVADSRGMVPGAEFSIRPARPELGALFVRGGHPLTAQASVSLQQVWAHGVASVRLPTSVPGALVALLGLPAGSRLPLAVECDNLGTLKHLAMHTDTAVVLPVGAVRAETARGDLVALQVSELPVIHSRPGIVWLQGRSLSPLARLIVSHLESLA